MTLGPPSDHSQLSVVSALQLQMFA